MNFKSFTSFASAWKNEITAKNLMSKEAVYGHIHTRSENDPNINSYGKKNLGGGPNLILLLKVP